MTTHGHGLTRKYFGLLSVGPRCCAAADDQQVVPTDQTDPLLAFDADTFPAHIRRGSQEPNDQKTNLAKINFA